MLQRVTTPKQELIAEFSRLLRDGHTPKQWADWRRRFDAMNEASDESMQYAEYDWRTHDPDDANHWDSLQDGIKRIAKSNGLPCYFRLELDDWDTEASLEMRCREVDVETDDYSVGYECFVERDDNGNWLVCRRLG